MTSEDKCRLTYAEGKRISEEAARPYVKRGGALIVAGTVVALISTLIGRAVGGLPFEASATEVIGRRIFEGDEGAIGVLHDYFMVDLFGTMLFTAMVVGGMCVMAMGSVYARVALKEANEKKE